jgi:uncharacterized repeat protein (TIGR01451 family)
VAGRIVAAVLVVAGLLIAVPVDDAQQPLALTAAALPGSTFQGADGDQIATSPATDWATLPAGAVAHSPDDNAQDTAFAGGSKEGTPGDWDLVNEQGGVNPAQANIRDAWSSVDQVGANTFLYLAFAREKGTGTTFLTFELNRDHQLWNNGHALIPCRRTGDLLITFEVTGNDVTVSVQTWTTVTADPMTGCARTGSLNDASVTANAAIQGAMNDATITNYLQGSIGGTIPAQQFGETAINLGDILSGALGTPCGAFTSFWMHSRSSTSENSNMQDFVAPHAIDARRCSAAGTKWLDNNADGVRDPGDVPLAGFRIYADLNNNRRFDEGEPFAITDANGDYVIDDVPATGTYTLREQPTSAVPLRGPWRCSHPSPCRYTVDAAAEPYAKNRDFGNWRPARLTLKKQLDPPSDPGRFDLSAGSSRLTVPAAGDGDRRTFSVRPGTYTVTETPVNGTDAADYVSSVSCRPITRPARLLRGTGPTTVTVVGGERVECLFVNVRRGTPSVTLDKVLVEPQPPMHGDTLRYQLTVTNTGDVAFRAGAVDVTDPACNDKPAVIDKFDAHGADDSTPDSLDPQDTWVYECHRATDSVNPDQCEPTKITNTGHVSVPGASDEDDTENTLGCPKPPEPGIQIQKIGPSTAVAGTPLTYVFYVYNSGEVAFTEANVTVSDPACDSPPQRVGRFQRSGNPDTSSPDVLNPGDVWVYVCTNTTAAPGPDCQSAVVTNTGTVVAESDRPTVDDSDDFETPLTCPTPGPTPPEPTPQPQPEPPAPIPEETPSLAPSQTPSLTPPTAGVAGESSVSPIRGCLRHGSRVVVSGSRIASITVTVGGRRVGGLRVQPLQRRAIIQIVGNPAPGRYHVTATIRFQRGAGTPTVRLTRTVRVCARAAQAPNFTG